MDTGKKNVKSQGFERNNYFELWLWGLWNVDYAFGFADAFSRHYP